MNDICETCKYYKPFSAMNVNQSPKIYGRCEHEEAHKYVNLQPKDFGCRFHKDK